MYTIHDYARMMSDQARMSAYAAALRKLINPGCVVLDIGTGPGVCALLACQYGARKVYAIEPLDIIQVARECAATAGVCSRIEFIQDLSTNIDLPEKVHGVVCDLRGALPMFGTSLDSIIDARERFLASGGWIIPVRDTLWVSIVSCAEIHREILGIWNDNPYALDMGPAAKRGTNRIGRISRRPLQLLADPKLWATIDYLELSSPSVVGQAELHVHTEAEAHGLSAWFDCETANGFGFSCNPMLPETRIYRQAFFPWPESLILVPGDAVSVSFQAIAIGSDYLWRWSSHVRSPGGRTKATFDQNDLADKRFSPDKLRRSTNTYLPTLTQDGEITLRILERMREGVRLEEIAREVSAKYPDRYPQWESALPRVGALSAEYSS